MTPRQASRAAPVEDLGVAAGGPVLGGGASEHLSLQRIADAQRFYLAAGYPLLPAGWLVSEGAVGATAPPRVTGWRAEGGMLVGSAEQAFVQQFLDGRRPGRGQAWTPCFRHEPTYDELHQPYFLKLELIDTERPDSHGLEQMLTAALRFFASFLPVHLEAAPGGVDIVTAEGIELGSYGLRTLAGPDGRRFSWAYGTGLAEPRLAAALDARRH